MGFKRIKKTLDNGLPHGAAAFKDSAGGAGNAAAQAQLPKGGSGSDTPMLDKAEGSVNIGYSANEVESAADNKGVSYTDNQMKGGGGVDANVDAGADSENPMSHGGSLKLGGSGATPKGKKKAVVIGNANYTSPDVADLPGAARDAGTMAGSLSDYEVSQVADQTRSGIANAMSGGMNGLGRGDHLVLYYAGHGLPEGLIGVEVDAHNPMPAVLGVDAITALVNKARSAGFHLTAVLDSCHAGSVADAVRNDQLAKLEGNPNLPAPAKAVLKSAKTLESAQADLRPLASRGAMQGGRGFKRGQDADEGGEARGLELGSKREDRKKLEALTSIWTRATIAATEIGVHVEGSKVAGMLPDKESWLDSETTHGHRADVLDRMSNQTLTELIGLMPQS